MRASADETPGPECQSQSKEQHSQRLWDHLVSQGYLDGRGQAQDTLQETLGRDGVVLPDEFEPLREAVTRVLRRFTTRIKIKKADERRRVKPREAVLDGAEFQALPDRPSGMARDRHAHARPDRGRAITPPA